MIFRLDRLIVSGSAMAYFEGNRQRISIETFVDGVPSLTRLYVSPIALICPDGRSRHSETATRHAIACRYSDP